MLNTLIGLAAAVLTTASYIPQVWKCWRTGEAGDLSLRMLLVLSSGIALWIAYGFMQGDLVIILANSASLTMLATLTFFRVRADRR